MKKCIIRFLLAFLLFSCDLGNEDDRKENKDNKKNELAGKVNPDEMTPDDPNAYDTLEYSTSNTIVKAPEGELPEEATKDSFYDDVEEGVDATSSNKKLKIKKHNDGRIYVGLMSRGGGNSKNSTLFIVKEGEESKFKNAMTSGSGSFNAYGFYTDKKIVKSGDKNYSEIEVKTKNDNKVSFQTPSAETCNNIDKDKLKEIIEKLGIN